MRGAGETGPVGADEPVRPSGATEMDRSVAEACRYQVFDGGGQFVGVFESWDAAHTWGHQQAAEPRARLPLRIEDQLDGRTWTVGPGLCRLSVWRRQSEPQSPPLYVTAAVAAAAAAGSAPAQPARSSRPATGAAAAAEDGAGP